MIKGKVSKKEKMRLESLNKLIKEGYKVDKEGHLVHRTVCYRAHGFIPRDWLVLHIDFDRNNNTPDNLIALPKSVYMSVCRTYKSTGDRMKRSSIEKVLSHFKKQLQLKNPNINIKVVNDHEVQSTSKINITAVLQRIRGKRSGSSNYR